MQHSIAISQVETQGTIHQNQDIQLVEVACAEVYICSSFTAARKIKKESIRLA